MHAELGAQNTVKIIWNMDRVFLEDPRRRYTFGYTIENRTLRMWFASRSEIVVSNPIDFFKVGILYLPSSRSLNISIKGARVHHPFLLRVHVRVADRNGLGSDHEVHRQPKAPLYYHGALAAGKETAVQDRRATV